MHRKVFYAIHSDRMRLSKPDEIAAFMAKNGVDARQVHGRLQLVLGARPRRARRASSPQAYKIDAVPAMGVAGPLLPYRHDGRQQRPHAGGGRRAGPAIRKGAA